MALCAGNISRKRTVAGHHWPWGIVPRQEYRREICFSLSVFSSVPVLPSFLGSFDLFKNI